MRQPPALRFHVDDSTVLRLNVPFINDLGVEYISDGMGRGIVALNLEPRHLNSWAVAHGGVLMSMLDVVMAIAGRSLFPDAGAGITIEMKTTFVQPAKEKSRLTGIGQAYHRSRTMAFCEGEIRDQDDRLVAKSSGIFKYKRAERT